MLSVHDINRLEPENKKLKKQLGLARMIMENILYCLKTDGADDSNGDCQIKDIIGCKNCQCNRIENFLKEIEELENGDKNDKEN